MEWISSKKNDIIADHFSFFLSQFPEDDAENFDIFYSKFIILHIFKLEVENISFNEKIKEVIY